MYKGLPYSIIGNTSDFDSEITGSSPVRVTNFSLDVGIGRQDRLKIC